MTASANIDERSVFQLCHHDPSDQAALGPAIFDDEQLSAFKYRVLHRVLSSSDPDAPVRIWIPCAAEGLAAYALAAIVLDSAGALDHATVRIYGTDANRDSILTARLGAYKYRGASSIPRVLRPHAYFADEEWWVTRHLRRLCVFAEHDTLQDPPFPNLNAIGCGVIQINEEPIARRVLPLFHYSLSRTGGYLLTGRELPAWSRELFDRVDEEKNIYRWRATTQRYVFTFPMRPGQDVKPIVKASKERMGRLLNQNSQLKDSVSEYRRIFEATRLPFILVDTALRLREFHAGPEAPFHLTPEHVGLRLADLPLNLDSADLQEHLTEVMLRGQSVTQELSDHSGRWFSVRTHPYRDEWGGIAGAVLLFIDITPQREAQQRAESARQEAEAGRDQAEAVSKAKDQFLALISHELRTPLAPVMNWTRLLRHAALSADQRERALQVIERNVQVQRRLIEDLLDVSRIVAGKLEIKLAEIDIAKVIEAAVETVRSSADARRITIATKLIPGCMIKGDPDRLQQVIWNLLANAIKFSQDGLAVDVSMRCEERGVSITVTDYGDGIDPAALSHVFEKFWQGDRGSTRRYGGLGLGLTIVQTVVEMHGGRVRAHSAGRGKGSSFEVWLPLSAPQQP